MHFEVLSMQVGFVILVGTSLSSLNEHTEPRQPASELPPKEANKFCKPEKPAEQKNHKSCILLQLKLVFCSYGRRVPSS